MLTALHQHVKRIRDIVQYAGRRDSRFLFRSELLGNSISQLEAGVGVPAILLAFRVDRSIASLAQQRVEVSGCNSSGCGFRVGRNHLRQVAWLLAAVTSRRAAEKRRGSKASGDRFSSAARRFFRWKGRGEREQDHWSSDLPQSTTFPKDRLQMSPDFVRR